MAIEIMRFTDAAVRALPPATDKPQYRVRDEELKGFYVVVGRKAKTYVAQADLRQHQRRVKTCNVAIKRTDQLSARKARAKAKELLALISQGQDPSKPARRKGATTLEDAWNDYEEYLESQKRSEGTIWAYRDCIERVMQDWLKLPIAAISTDRQLLRDRHKELTKERGPYMANHALGAVRAVYNYAAEVDGSLPPWPPKAFRRNPEKRRDTGMGYDDLAAWRKQLDALPNPIRRELHLFLLLSGSRPGPIVEARWEHLTATWHEQKLHIPNPKGGTERAFDIPLSRQMLLCLYRARKARCVKYPHLSDEWIFPAESKSGHIAKTCWKEKRENLSKWGNELRQTYRTLAQETGVNPTDIRLLMNHKDRDVSEGYITVGKLLPHLRTVQERITAHIIAGLNEKLKDDEQQPKEDAA